MDIIVCCDSKNGIGLNNKIPWSIPEDLAYFKNKTTNIELPTQQNVIIMGKKTAESLSKPLPNRINYVISSTDVLNFTTFKTPDLCLEHIDNNRKTLNINKVFIIGGQQLYEWALTSYRLENVYVGYINKDFGCDRFFTLDNDNFEKLSETKINVKENNAGKNVCINYHHLKCTNAEANYLRLMKKILDEGDYRKTRNGNTYSMFGGQIKFDLKHFPLLTSKKVSMKIVFDELLFFLKGKTDVQYLKDRNVHIWDANTTKEFITAQGLDYEENIMGPLYGAQFRSYGAVYNSKDADNIGKGFDQLTFLIEQIKKNKNDRRLLMTSYNPIDAQKSVLYPCHGIVIQFYVNNDKLSCHVYQRSCDIFLGASYNYASYALFIHSLCEIINNTSDNHLTPGELYFSYGDVHIYEDHISAVKQQLQNSLYKFPTIKFNRKITCVDDMEYADVTLENYKSHGIIKAKMLA